MLYINKLFSLVIIFQFLCSVTEADAAVAVANNQSELNLQEIILPSEAKDLTKNVGAIYYSTSVKNKVLIPVHIWGEIKQSGLHFMPSDTSFIKGLSLAGGPNSFANLNEIVVKRNSADGSFKEIPFDLSKGGDVNAHHFKLESGDSIFVKKETFYENRSYYTSLISIFISVLSTFVIIQKVK